MLAAVAMYLSRRSLGTTYTPPVAYIEPMQEKPVGVPKLPDGIGNDLKRALQYNPKTFALNVNASLDGMGDTGPLI